MLFFRGSWRKRLRYGFPRIIAVRVCTACRLEAQNGKAKQSITPRAESRVLMLRTFLVPMVYATAEEECDVADSWCMYLARRGAFHSWVGFLQTK